MNKLLVVTVCHERMQSVTPDLRQMLSRRELSPGRDESLMILQIRMEGTCPMITCVVDYTIVPDQVEAFEAFARRWIELVDKHGGQHHGYFLPSEGASDKALALFTFPSLAAYEQYRSHFEVAPEFVAADRIRDESGCVVRYERTFMRPLL